MFILKSGGWVDGIAKTDDANNLAPEKPIMLII